MADEVITTPFGKFLVNPVDCIGSTLKAGTLWDGPGFLQVIAKEYARFSEVGTTILDIGANVGSFSIYCASKGAWRVIAVEPIFQTMGYLKANLDLNQDTCADVVIPLEIAAYDQPATLWVDEYDPSNMGGTALVTARVARIQPAVVAVAAEPLDCYAYLYGDRVSLIKVDAQGCDGAALFGLKATIHAHRPAIVFEWEADLARPHRICFGDVTDYLASEHYQIYPWPSQPNNYLAVSR